MPSEKLPLSSSELAMLSEAFPDPLKFAEAAARAEAGEPVAYITGEQAFFREIYFVTPDVLIPRPDTERVAEKAIEWLRRFGDGARMLDLCTGSGCIAVSVFRNSPCRVRIDAADISEAALAVARRNAERYSAEIPFYKLDVTDESAAASLVPGRKWDVIVSNPPYIDSAVIDTLDSSVKDHEPTLALDGGFDGMRFYRAIMDNFAARLSDRGVFVFEIGYDQREKIISEAKARGFVCDVTKDWGGNDRTAVIRSK